MILVDMVDKPCAPRFGQVSAAHAGRAGLRPLPRRVLTRRRIVDFGILASSCCRCR